MTQARRSTYELEDCRRTLVVRVGDGDCEQAAITGLAFGTIFAITGRLWTLMVMHASFDLTAVALIYWNLESSVAHWIFK